MTDSEIKALAGKLLEKQFGHAYGIMLHPIMQIPQIISAMMEMYKAALSGTEPFNGDEDEYVEKVKKIMEANETGGAEAIVDEIIMPIKAGARQYWKAAQSKHEELRRLESGTERVECYLPCSKEEAECFIKRGFSKEFLKKVTLTVVRESDYEPSKEQSQASVASKINEKE